MSDKKIVLTVNGLRRLEQELEDLKINKRKEVAQKIKEARDQGDLSENAEYDGAKEEQAEIEARIANIEKTLRYAEVIDEEELNTSNVSVGSSVRVRELEFNEEIVYTIVGSTEADPFSNKISNESPVGIALLNAIVGGIVEAKTPAGTFSYEVLEIMK